jgi:putative transposase
VAGTVGTRRKDGPSGPSAPKNTAPSRAPALSEPRALPRRKPRPRIGSFDYRGPHGYHIILLTQGRAPHFTDRSLAHRCVKHLKTTAERLGFRLLAFSLMPDHLHVLVLGRNDAADLIRFVQRFKQVTAFDFKRETGLRLWQQSFYDHVLRAEEDLASVAAYILANPIRAGLAAQSDEYPLSGGEYLEADAEAADGAKAPSLRPAREASARVTGGPRG